MRSRRTKTRNKRPAHTAPGFILYVTVMVLSALMLGFALLGSYMAQARSRIDIGQTQKSSVGLAASSCMEVALQSLGSDNTYTGNVTLDVDGYSCQIRPVYRQDNQWVIETQAQDGAHTYRQRCKLSSLTPMTVVSWIEIPQF